MIFHRYLVIAVSAVSLVESGGDKVNKYPWLVRIDAGRKGSCAGTLVNKRWVLTSAACVNRRKRFAIYVRDYSRTRRDGEQMLKASRVYVHPYYFEWTMEYDLALIKLNRPVNTRGASGVIDQLSTIKTDVRLFRGDKQCVVIGWGENKAKSVRWRANTLPQTTDVMLAPDNDCDDAETYIPGFQGCVKNKNNNGPCKKDTGGPIACKLNRKWVLVGVYSYSLGAAKPKGSVGPCQDGNMVSSRISYNKKWIENVIARRDTDEMERVRALKYRLIFNFWDADQDGLLSRDNELALVSAFRDRANNTEKVDIFMMCWVGKFVDNNETTVYDMMESSAPADITKKYYEDDDDLCVDATFTTVDDNDDGMISRDEFHAYTCLFNHCDTDTVDRVFQFYKPVGDLVPRQKVIRKWATFFDESEDRTVDRRYIDAVYEMIFA